MIEFNGAYFAVSEIVRVIPFDTGDIKYPKGLNLILKNGDTYGVKYITLRERDTAKYKLINCIERELKSDEIQLNNLRLSLETSLKRIEARQLRLHRVLKSKLSPDQVTE